MKKYLLILILITISLTCFATDYGFDGKIWYRVAGSGFTQDGFAEERFNNGTDKFNKNDSGTYILFGSVDTYEKIKNALSGNWYNFSKSMVGDGVDILTRKSSSYDAMVAYLDDYIEVTGFNVDWEFWYAVVFIPDSYWKENM